MKNSIFITIITASLLAACRKHEVQNPSFDVALLEKATYKVGEEVTFNLSGEADQVTFYSGEMLH
ncbi:DUF5017 domain-containing protein, partial [Parapusillimonas sp. SGNA-6]|nr:DUF5017 domain-containing protein [Parapusillimonas sp. SGNA-6]